MSFHRRGVIRGERAWLSSTTPLSKARVDVRPQGSIEAGDPRGEAWQVHAPAPPPVVLSGHAASLTPY